MQKIILLLAFVIIIFSACNETKKSKENNTINITENPLLQEFELPPFDKIELKHYQPALEYLYAQHEKIIDSIANSTEEATFENTIEALERSWYQLDLVNAIFSNVNSACTNDSMQALAKKLSIIEAQHTDKIRFNAKLFARIKTIHNKKEKLNLNQEQQVLLKKQYEEFVRGGALLSDEDKQKFSKINEELSVLKLQFGENLIAETNAFKLIIDNENDLSGLPQSVIDAAHDEAIAQGDTGKWVFTLHKPSMIPFLKYADNRTLREQLHKAYTMRCNNDNDHDNTAIVKKIVELRIEKIKLLGYTDFSSFILEQNMAKKPEAVEKHLMRIWDYALPAAKKELEVLQKFANKNGADFELKHWDWWYYADKYQKEKFSLNDELLQPYFELSNVLKGAFQVATNLYGITFKKMENIPLYHKDAVVYEVLEANGKHIGVLYTDFYQRSSKRGGAWMTSFRKQYKMQEKNISPIISIVCNFPKPSQEVPSLLTFTQVQTLFHEFGHALHGLLSNCTYKKLSGTAVPRDFVELPSQIMENWAGEKEVLKLYAKHYKTGEMLPDELIEKLKESSKFNQGFATTEHISAAILDYYWHVLQQPISNSVNDFENQILDSIQLIDEIIVRYRSTYFAHIFSGGYASGYYGYSWAEVLDADAFNAFKETGNIFDKETAAKFRNNVLSKGGTDNAMKLYKQFRGAEPQPDAFLLRKGLK